MLFGGISQITNEEQKNQHHPSPFDIMPIRQPRNKKVRHNESSFLVYM